MNVFLAALVASALAFFFALVWYAWVTPESLPAAPGLGTLWLLIYVTACILGIAARRTFAAGARDGLAIGFYLWLATAAVGAANRLSRQGPARADWSREGYWLLSLPLIGAVMVWLTRLPNLLELYFN